MGDALRRAGLAALLVLAANACAAPPRPVAIPAPASAGAPIDTASLARILELEDTRSSDVAELAAFARSPATHVRARAVLALGRAAPPGAAPVLTALLDDPDTAVAASAAFALGELADSSTIAPLVAALGSRTVSTVAAEAAEALGKIRTPAAQQALLDFLARADSATNSPEAVRSALLGVWRFRRPADPAPILRWATSPDPEIRWRAVYALARRPEPRAAAALVEAARDSVPMVRAYALRGLVPAFIDSAGIARPAVLRLLVAATADPDYASRINAARSLGSFTEPEAVASLVALLPGQDRHLAITAMESLGRIGSRAVSAEPSLAGIARSDDDPAFLRQTALESLALVDPGAAAVVAAGLATHGVWRLRASAARALARQRGAPSQALRTLLDDPDSRVATAALQAVSDVAGDSIAPVHPVFIERLGSADPFVRYVALSALARLRDPATLPLLLDAYDVARTDSVNDAALAALDAIAALRDDRLAPERAFFSRFPRSPDYLVRRKAEQHFGAAAREAWGDAGPAETGRDATDYRTIVAAAHGPDASPTVRFDTDAGEFVVRLFRREAPLTVESFLALARRDFFDGQEWPRVVANFVVQGGDPRGDTNGGPGYAIRDEMNRHPYLTGTMGMALAGPDTGGSQFFLTHSPQPHLDGEYTVFGEVVDGQSVLERILPGDRIHSVTIVP